MSEKKIYGLNIEKCGNVCAADILDMSDEQKHELIEKAGIEEQVYTIEGFFYYLNADMLDTENCYWVAV